jgi:hypothetical protein
MRNEVTKLADRSRPFKSTCDSSHSHDPISLMPLAPSTRSRRFVPLLLLLAGCAIGGSGDALDSSLCSCAVNQASSGTSMAIGSMTTALSAPMSLAQSFVLSEAVAIQGVQIETERVSVSSNASIPILVSIYTDDAGTNSPSTTVIANSIPLPTTAAFTSQYISYCWDSSCTATVQLNPLTKYWLVITRSADATSISDLNYVAFAASATAGTTQTQLKAKIIGAAPQVWSSVVGLTDISSWALTFRLGCENTNYAGCSL